MSTHDVIVVGAGLAGLSAARDLAAAGADVLVLEARARAGGRVEQTTMADGRLVQLGGEVVGASHTSYRTLVEELGLTLGPSFTDIPGESTWLMNDGRFLGDEMPWMSARDRALYEEIERRFSALAGSVDPDDPWAHPDAHALDRLSVGDWLRSEGATPDVVRAMELRAMGLADASVERRSLLADLRKEASAGALGFYDYEAWESEKVVEGSATVALRMAEQLGHRVRYSSPVATIDVGSGGAQVSLHSGERFRARDVVCALPAGPLRDLRISGVSAEYLGSLRRREHAPTAKFVTVYESSFWEANGQNGTGYFERTLLGGTWVQNAGMLSALVPVDRLGPYRALPADARTRVLLGELGEAYGPEGASPAAVFVRDWHADTWTQGYITAWRPGELTAVGPLHGSHEPPFWVVGSDQWVCGYMEGAVRTGRAAARQLLSG
ncbi:MAG: FAD-dependent oxidoreductase [Actinobacteria bacterium]|nr:FAD-dependent oxidoreductase [Actinomycetota bacterium]MBU1607974.1 FAD-dependent oxidoreductase [Actinomycetota bacterium]MBU2316150.1 FAD-dependent oxidoreductase [Actinomycetota bacterium]MBU2386178.1 FAD-dependent oxidoreductase [Actinomycetota bacterium]